MATQEHEMNTPLPDFDVLVALYQHDPDAFEDFRRHVLREAVDCAPACHRPTLERMLESIEEARGRAATPMEAARIASQLMQDSARRLCEAWIDAHEAVAGLQATLVIEQAREKRTCQ
jgi:hypothetical protein